MRKQGDISAQRNMPVAVLNDSSLITSVSGETLQFYYYNSGVLTQDAGQAAGVLVIGKLAYAPVLDDMGSKVANKDNKSLSFTCAALTTEKEFDWTKLEQSFDTTGTILLQNICAGFSNGDYTIDYRTGTVYAKKATTATTATSVAYKIPGKAPIAVTLSASDIEIGAVELKNGADDTRGTITTADADAVSNTQNNLQTGARLSGFNGTTWDRIRTGLVAVQTAFTGILNTISMGRYNLTPPTLADGNIAPLQMDANGNLKTNVQAVVPGVAATNLGKAEDAVHTSGDVGVMDLGVANEAQASFGADGDYMPKSTDVKGNLMNVGNIPHDTADAGNPVKIGGKAVSAEPAVVTANDRVNALFDLVGKQIVLPYANPENFVSGAITTAMTGTTSTSLVAAPAAGLRNYITTIIVSNAHATVGTDIIIQDGSGGTTLLTIPAAAVYGGAVITLPTPLRQPTTATALYCANVTTGASTKVSAVGYKGV